MESSGAQPRSLPPQPHQPHQSQQSRQFQQFQHGPVRTSPAFTYYTAGSKDRVSQHRLLKWSNEKDVWTCTVRCCGKNVRLVDCYDERQMVLQRDAALRYIDESMPSTSPVPPRPSTPPPYGSINTIQLSPRVRQALDHAISAASASAAVAAAAAQNNAAPKSAYRYGVSRNIQSTYGYRWRATVTLPGAPPKPDAPADAAPAKSRRVVVFHDYDERRVALVRDAAARAVYDQMKACYSGGEASDGPARRMPPRPRLNFTGADDRVELPEATRVLLEAEFRKSGLVL